MAIRRQPTPQFRGAHSATHAGRDHVTHRDCDETGRQIVDGILGGQR